MTEPTPVLPLEYRRDQDEATWLGIVRLLAMLCIIEGAATGITSGVSAWSFGSSKALFIKTGWSSMAVSIVVWTSVSDLSLSILLMMAGAGCLARIQFCRRLVVVCCWMQVFLAMAHSAVEFFIYASRNGFWFGVTYLAYSISYAMFPVAVAVIFSRKLVVEAFSVQ
jgi:hypothetical protein